MHKSKSFVLILSSVNTVRKSKGVIVANLTQQVDSFWNNQATWDNPNLYSWNDLDHSLDMELMRKKSQWCNLGKSDEQLTKEIIEERKAAAQGR